MTDVLIMLLLAIVLFIVFSKKKKKSDDVVWLDKGKSTKPLVSHTFKLVGKPDAIMKDTIGRLTLVEYKSRNKGVYKSDIVQAKAAAIVMRENGYDIQQIVIKTKTDSHVEALPQSSTVIFNEIESFIALTRRALNKQKVPAYPSTFKCRYCSKRHNCSEAA